MLGMNRLQRVVNFKKQITNFKKGVLKTRHAELDSASHLTDTFIIRNWNKF